MEATGGKSQATAIHLIQGLLSSTRSTMVLTCFGSSGRTLLMVPKFWLVTKGDRAFAVRAPQPWNPPAWRFSGRQSQCPLLDLFLKLTFIIWPFLNWWYLICLSIYQSIYLLSVSLFYLFHLLLVVVISILNSRSYFVKHFVTLFIL